MNASGTSLALFIKSIASFRGDLSTSTAPPFILSPTSLSEYSKYWGEHPDLLIGPNFLREFEGADSCQLDAMSLKRMIAVVKWFVSTLRSQYSSRSENLGNEKKPLNPFLGEVFVGKWEDKSDDGKLGESILLSEQVSHHPPVTAYGIINKKNNIILQGYNGVRSNFSTTLINIQQYGHAILEYVDLNESYLITLPSLHIAGLITGSTFVELEDRTYIQASNGHIAVIEFSGKGFFTGKKNSFKARIYRDKISTISKGNALVTIAGQWSDKSYIKKGSSFPSLDNELFYDAKSKHPQELVVKPIEKQHRLESRKAWFKVSEAIKSSDYNLIQIEKSIIENSQRHLRIIEKKEDKIWKSRWFNKVDYLSNRFYDAFINLTNQANLSIHNCPSGTEKKSKLDKGTAEHWRIDLTKWDNETEIIV